MLTIPVILNCHPFRKQQNKIVKTCNITAAVSMKLMNFKKKTQFNYVTKLTDITSHHMEKTEAGLKGLCIRKILTK